MYLRNRVVGFYIGLKYLYFWVLAFFSKRYILNICSHFMHITRQRHALARLMRAVSFIEPNLFEWYLYSLYRVSCSKSAPCVTFMSSFALYSSSCDIGQRGIKNLECVLQGLFLFMAEQGLNQWEKTLHTYILAINISNAQNLVLYSLCILCEEYYTKNGYICMHMHMYMMYTHHSSTILILS